MKKITILLFVILLGGFTFNLMAQNKNRKESSAFIRELVERIKNEKEIDEARYPDLIKEVEQYAMSCDKPGDAAVLHSLLADMYASFERRNAWKFARRTPIANYVPEDLNEWTSNLFQEKITDEYRLSLQPAELLRQIPIGEYGKILQLGKDEALRPSLYDYLLYKAISFKPTEELYEQLIAYKKKANNPQALMLASLDYLDFLHLSGAIKGDSAYLQALDSLYQAYAPFDYAAEILIRRVQCMENGEMRNMDNTTVSVYPEIVDWCQLALKRHPSYERIGFFENKLAQIQNPEIQVSIPSVIYPGQDMDLKLRYKNLTSIHIKVYETDLNPEKMKNRTSNGQKGKEEVNRRLIRQIRSVLTPSEFYQTVDTVIRISGLDENGVYEYEVLVPDTDLESSHFVFVTYLMAVSRSSFDTGTEVWVTDMKSGEPIEEAKVLLYGYKSNEVVLLDSLWTGSRGLVKIPPNENIRYYRVVHGDDRFMPLSSLSSGRRILPMDTGVKTNVALFTDRGLYRPGQTVFVKGLVYGGDKDDQQVIPNREVKLVLRDANHKEIATQTFITNEFGSFHGEFLLPRYGLNGSFSLSAENTTQFFQVEEYKRPSFYLAIDSIKEEIAFGDTVRIGGKVQTYSGAALQKGTVNYRIVLRPFRYYFSPSFFEETVVLSGETELDGNGTFQFDFVPEMPEQQSGLAVYSSYEIAASLTDSKGETQEVLSLFSVGTSRFVLSTDLSDVGRKESLSVKVQAQTLNGESVSTQGNFEICPLLQSKQLEKGTEEWQCGEAIETGTFSTEEVIGNAVFASLPSGRYRLRLEARDSKGQKVEREQDFVLYSDKDKRPPVFSDIWLLDGELEASPGEEVQFVFGTSHKKAHVLYELIANKKRVLCKELDLSDENRKIVIPFSEDYGDGLVAMFSLVKEGNLYTRQLPVYIRRPNRKLVLKTETFRDRLLPGSREHWKLKVLTSDSLPAVAEILASMYDASLDAILPFNWSFSPEYRPLLYVQPFGRNSAYTYQSGFSSGKWNYIDVPEFQYSRFDWEDALLDSYTYLMRSSYALTSMKAKDSIVEEDRVMEESEMNVVPAALGKQADGAKERSGEEHAAPLRRNFQETAFFFPVLRTDKDGGWVLDFSLPESNTTWKFQALAHTKDLKYGQLKREIVSSKPLMVLPNLPRFVRVGDEVDIRAQLINCSELELSGQARLEWFNPETDEIVLCLTKAQIPFAIEAGRQTMVHWRVKVPAGYDLAGVRVVAETESVSDGEQHLLPVLPNEMLVTESVPFYLSDEKEKELAFPVSSEATARSYRQILELSANPVWYAVQALPALLRPAHNSASDWFSSYYANTLASFIVQANPRIQTVIEQWSAAGGDATSLRSKLEQNEDLKNVVLAETPWVLEAETETEQIQRLAILFDLNRATIQRVEALQELIRLQREDGAWGWFEGFGADRYVTVSILQGMADLVHLNAVEYGQSERELQMRALNYLDEKIREDYDRLQKNAKEIKQTVPSEIQLAYLFMRSSYRDIPETVETREAIRFYTGQAEKYWEKLPVHMRVQTALLLFRNGEKEKARTIMNWFVRTASRTEEEGVFWANNRRNGFSPVSPIETHVLLMNAFAEMGIDELEIDRMKQWLLNQKRTQYWESVPATLNAVYALLLTGEEWLKENNRVIVNWGDEVVDSRQGIPGTGYVKKVRSGLEDGKDNRILVRKEGNAPAWGALYHQYFERMDQVQAQNGALAISKRFFREKVSEKGKQLVALDDSTFLRVGDKIVVRLTLRAKQEMTYVHLKDTWAACFEPVEQVSGTYYRDGIVYYKTSKDASEHFYFDRLPKGVFVIEYAVYVSRAGDYISGTADLQCLYAPEYSAHTAGERLIIKD